MEEKDIIKKLSKMIEPERLLHSIGVSKSAKELAPVYGIDADKAVIAGLLHDCAKDFNHDELIEKCKEYGIEPDWISIRQRGLIHGPLGARIAKQVFSVEDPDILSAIEFHTFGKKDMSILEKVIYLSDLIEEGREFDGVEKLRSLARTDLDAAMIKALDSAIIKTITKGGLIHPNTLEARNYLIENKVLKNKF
ncbi:MAG: HD domain-containing protein [Clostridiales bacterium]|nr:HD domain-containing protein [Clostridiales bacterium]